jgi:hypothetical protein
MGLLIVCAVHLSGVIGFPAAVGRTTVAGAETWDRRRSTVGTADFTVYAPPFCNVNSVFPDASRGMTVPAESLNIALLVLGTLHFIGDILDTAGTTEAGRSSKLAGMPVEACNLIVVSFAAGLAVYSLPS